MTGLQIKLILTIALLASLVGSGFYISNRIHNAEERATVAEAAAASLSTQLTQAKANVRTVTVYTDRIKTIRAKAETIIKEVPVYVSSKSDAACSIPVGFVWLHDDSAKGEPTDHAGNPDETAPGIALSTVAETVSSNYAICHENAEQLKAVQKRLIEQGVEIQ